MSEIRFHNRRAVQIENDSLRLTVTVEGGHVAELLHKRSGISPLWIPPWPSIEPSTYSPERHPEYGNNNESRLLSGIMGHNLCLDLFGPPSDAEYAAGISVHGEASVLPYEVNGSGDRITARCTLAQSQLRFERILTLTKRGVRFGETVENLSAFDRASAWTQHVTLGPPFLERGVTQFRAPGTKSREIGTNRDFDWPAGLETYTQAESSGGFTAHLMDPHRTDSYFYAFSPTSNVLFGYMWKRTDFPWLGIWEENHSRDHAPWNKRTLTRGMEFGASPFPETRRQMIERRELFGVPGYRWIPAKSKVYVEYHSLLTAAKRIPDTLEEAENLA